MHDLENVKVSRLAVLVTVNDSKRLDETREMMGLWRGLCVEVHGKVVTFSHWISRVGSSTQEKNASMAHVSPMSIMA